MNSTLPFFKVGDLSAAGNERYLRSCSNWVTVKTAQALGAVAVPAGSILLPKIGAALFGNARRITTQPTVFDNNVLAVVPRGIDSRYLYYWMATVDLAELANPGPIPSLADSALLDQTVPCNDVAAQRMIADFLDAETARIDALMVRKRELIERLLEHRLATTLAGVRGDLTTAEVGPAADGVPWMPLQTAGWPTARLTLVTQLGSGHTPSRDHPEWWDDCAIPWITTGEVAQMRHDRIEYLTETREMISAAGIANSSATIHPAGTVVLSRTASAGFSAIMGIPMATSQDFVTWTCSPLLEPRYLLLCLRAMRTDLLERLAQGSTHKTIYMPDVESIQIPLPPIDEQRKIVEETWRRLKPLDRSVDRLGRQLGLLQERRQALITAAVTGELHLAEVG